MAPNTTTRRRKPGAPPRPKASQGKASRSKTSRPKEQSRKPETGKSSASGARAAADKAGPKSTTSPWEWAAALVGAAIFVGLVGFLVHAGFARPARPQPDIVALAGPAQRVESGAFLVPLNVENLGHMTGANVTVRGSLRDAGGTLIEESAATFDFVAQHSTETGGLYFTADPGAGTLTLRVEGYADP